MRFLPKIWFLGVVVAVATMGMARESEVGPSAFIAAQMAKAKVPGLAVAVVKRGEVVFARGYGYADLMQQSPITADSAFRVASVSKTLTGTALMQLYERGLFGLDDDISLALPFSVRHPHAPLQKITYRMLLTHTAGIADNYQRIDALWNWQGDAQTSLATLMHDYFTPGARLYSEANFLASSPGVRSQYSNMGVGLAGYLVEVLAGKPFATVITEQIAGPLQLASAAWSVAQPPAFGGLANMFAWDGQTRQYQEIPPYGYPEVPAGMLRISAHDLARFLIVHTSGGSVAGVRILQPATVRAMQRVQYPAIAANQGLIFYRIPAHGNLGPLMGHNGGDPGVTAEMYWVEGDPAGLGAVVVANSDATSDDANPQRGAAIYAILDHLLTFGAGL